VSKSLLDPVLLSFSEKRKAQKAKYFGELFPMQTVGGPSFDAYTFFQEDKDTHLPKGIVKLDLRSIP